MKAKSILTAFKEGVDSIKDLYELPEAKALIKLLMEKVTGVDYHHALVNPHLLLSHSQEMLLHAHIQELKLQKPIQYILGETEFFGINLKVNPHVLIPRPETEELVSWVLDERPNDFPAVLDIGTGSGCIAIAIAKRLPAAKVYALDISHDAVILAKENALTNSVNISFFQHDILGNTPPNRGVLFDIAVTNPPYVRNSEKQEMQANVLDYEPAQALFVDDENPLVFYRAVAETMFPLLAPNGTIFCEINEALGEETAQVFISNGFANVEIRKDIHGKDRMLMARKS